MKRPSKQRVRKFLDQEFRSLGGKNRYVEAIQFEDGTMVVQFDHISGPLPATPQVHRIRYVTVVGKRGQIRTSTIVDSWWEKP